MDWGVNGVMPGCDGLGILVVFEKSSEMRSDAGRGDWDLSLGEAGWFLSLGEASPVVAYGMCRASDRTVSIVKIVSLSPRDERLNSSQ